MQETFKKLPREKQIHILDSAATIFARSGYYRANIADICRQANISNGALYKYFKNKKILFNSVFQYVGELMMAEIFRAEHLQTPSFFDKIQELLHLVHHFAAGKKDHLTVYLDIGSESMNSFAADLSEDFEAPVRIFWEQLIAVGKRTGEIDSRINVQSASYLIDNNFMLFSFSLISEHHKRRFVSYFPDYSLTNSDAEKIQLVFETIRSALS